MNTATATTPLRISITGSPKFDTCKIILRKLGFRFDGILKIWEAPAGGELKLEMHYMAATNTNGADSTLEAALKYFGMVDVSKPKAAAAAAKPIHLPEIIETAYNGAPLTATERAIVNSFPAVRRTATPSRCHVCGGKVDLREQWARPGYCGCEGE